MDDTQEYNFKDSNSLTHLPNFHVDTSKYNGETLFLTTEKYPLPSLLSLKLI